MSELLRIPAICGPTGSGKTAIAVSLASTFPIEVVSADSRQIIRRLDIGTGKPTSEERQTVRFHLLDLIEPGERYSAYQFIEDVDAAISDIVKRKRIPMIVGGTGLYLRALVDGVIEIESDNPEIRERLQREMDTVGPDLMHRRLAEIDPAEALAIHPNNRVRVLRALEIYELTHEAKSKLMASGAYKKSRYEYDLYCLRPERAELYAAIEQRVDAMINSGLVAEVEGLVRSSLGPALRKANVIGYDEILDYLDDKCTLDEAVAMIKQNTRRYAKRQMTWFRHQLNCTFFEQAGQLADRLATEINSRREGR
ncbi:MAG: tRNA (adenosine(37)-N6)-dimethylallyltransferase MiaA [candidate division Zixibacteria bacterium]|nr:tRNA (adenosine(37)-N6)-dimethylallyltransferase MiaA [candidate division Zixibacteria bacterium]